MRFILMAASMAGIPDSMASCIDQGCQLCPDWLHGEVSREEDRGSR